MIGLAFDVLALRTSAGSGLALGIMCIAAAIGAAALRHGDSGARLAAAAALLFAGMLGVRSSEALLVINLVAVAGLCAVVVVTYAKPMMDWRLGSLFHAAAIAGGRICGEAARLVHGNVATSSMRTKLRRWRPALVGGVLAAPLLVVFLGLFMSADAVFADYVIASVSWQPDLGGELGHAVAVVIVAGLLLGLRMLRLRHTVIGDPPGWPVLAMPETTAITVLALVDGLFALFVIVQVTYLFGGADTLARSGLTYAEYARRGFFELVVVAALVLALLLVVDWLAQRRPQRSRLLDVLSIVLIALTMVVVVSDVRRMLLYVDAFGLTELRFYTTAWMGWLTLVLVLYLFTVLRSDRARFGAGVVAVSVVVVAALNVVNPDEVIATVNVDRHLVDSRALDAEYAAALGADAVPALLASPDALRRCDLVAGLEELRSELAETAAAEGWRATTLADRTGFRLLTGEGFRTATDRCG